MNIANLVVSFGATGAAQPITIAEQVYAAMPVGLGTVTQDRWRANPVTVNGIAFTLFPGMDSDGRADCWIYAAYGEAAAPNTFSPINREFAAVDLQVSLNGVAQNLFGAGTTFSYNHQRTTWLRWQTGSMAWDTSPAYINARIADGTFLRHDSRNVFGSSEDVNSGMPASAAYVPFSTFSTYDQTQYIGDVPRAATGGGERTSIGPVHEWFARLITEAGTNNNPAWLTPTRLQILKDLAETAAQFPHASGLLEPVTNRLLDPSVKPHCSHGNPNAWYGATGIPQPGTGTPAQYSCEYDNPHPLNKFSFQAWHLSKDPFHLLQVQGQAVCALTFQSLFGIGRGVDGKTLMISMEQERGLWWGLQQLVQAWHVTPSGTMPKPFRDKAWFALAINNTLQFLRDHYMSATNHIEAGIKGEAMRFWRAVGNMGTANGEFYNSHFQEDYGHIVLAQTLMLGYSGARDVAEWRMANLQNRISLGGSWFLNDYELELATNPQLSAYALSPDTGTLPYTDIAGYKAWYPHKTRYTNGPTVTADFWHQQYGRDTYLFLGAVNITKEAVRRGLLTPGFDIASAETELRARFVPPYTQPNSTQPLNYGIYAKQYFNYQGVALTAPVDTYQIGSGLTMYFGQSAPAAPVALDAFDSVSYTDSGQAMLNSTYDSLPLIVDFPGSNKSTGIVTSNGRNYTAAISGALAPPGQTSLKFDVFASQYADNNYYPSIHPRDHWITSTGAIREAQGFGFLLDDGLVHATQEHCINALMRWISTNMVQNPVKTIAHGGSMGAWAVITYGIRHYDSFAALYADRPRWRHGYPDDASGLNSTTISAPTWANDWVTYPVASSPLVAPADGGGTLYDRRDMVAYVANITNKVRWVGWCIGRQDGYACWQDQLDAVSALRAAGRGFAFAWNNGNHSTGSIMNQIMQSYPPGTFQMDRGYPLFTQHSLDNNPAVDLVGGINIGLKFRNVVETASGWQCEVTSVIGPCTVKVSPISDVYTGSKTAQLKTIPAANTWVPVTFSA